MALSSVRVNVKQQRSVSPVPSLCTSVPPIRLHKSKIARFFRNRMTEYHVTMEIIINGESISVPGNCTVSDLLQQQGLSGSPCAVEVNRELVPKREHDSHHLAAGDRVEVVTLVGGG